jgi:hypothetical protein
MGRGGLLLAWDDMLRGVRGRFFLSTRQTLLRLDDACGMVSGSFTLRCSILSKRRNATGTEWLGVYNDYTKERYCMYYTLRCRTIDRNEGINEPLLSSQLNLRDVASLPVPLLRALNERTRAGYVTHGPLRSTIQASSPIRSSSTEITSDRRVRKPKAQR